jgi:hypothetical protein
MSLNHQDSEVRSMSYKERPRRSSRKCALGGGRAGVVAERGSDGRSRSGAAERGPTCRVQGPDRRRPVNGSWDDKMAEAIAFLVSAHATLECLSGEADRNAQTERMLASVSGKVFEALCTLDDFSVTRWTESGSSAGTSYSFAHLPSRWACLNR